MRWRTRANDGKNRREAFSDGVIVIITHQASKISERPAMVQFELKPRWKEELVCSCALGSFVLDMPMGVVSVYLPTKEYWKEVAPTWAMELWDALYQQLQEWCENQKIPLHFDATGYAGANLGIL